MQNRYGSQCDVLDISLKRLEELDNMFGGHIQILFSSDSNIEAAVKDADLVIGSVLIGRFCSEALQTQVSSRKYWEMPECGDLPKSSAPMPIVKKALKIAGSSTAVSPQSKPENRLSRRGARVEQLEHELAYTRQEVEFLKKTHGRFGGSETMGIQAAPELKFALIRQATQRDGNLLKSAPYAKSPVFPGLGITDGAKQILPGKSVRTTAAVTSI